MKTLEEFPFKKSRRITSLEVKEFRKAIAKKTGQSPSQRAILRTNQNEKLLKISLNLPLQVVNWAKKESKKSRKSLEKFLSDLLFKLAA